MTDFSRIPTRQDAIHLRLERWARWVRVTPRPWGIHPMWRHARTSRQWDAQPHIPEAMNTLEAHETERAVAFLPAAHRMAIRWAYVYPFVSNWKVQRELAVSAGTLALLLVYGRDMLVHRPIQSRPEMGMEWTHYAKASVQKNRNGRCGVLHLHYQGDQTRFTSWAGDAPTRATAYGGKGREL